MFDKLLYFLGCNCKNYITTAYSLNTCLYNISPNYNVLYLWQLQYGVLKKSELCCETVIWQEFYIKLICYHSKNILINIKINY